MVHNPIRLCQLPDFLEVLGAHFLAEIDMTERPDHGKKETGCLFWSCILGFSLPLVGRFTVESVSYQETFEQNMSREINSPG